jgi:hypothetical protein
MPANVSPAYGDLGRTPGLEVHSKLTQTSLHSAGKPDGNLAQSPAEVDAVELTMEQLQPVEELYVAGTRPFPARLLVDKWHIGVNREVEELPLRHSPDRSRHSGIQEADDRVQDFIRRKGVAPMNSEYSPVQAQHYRLVRVGQDLFDIPETEPAEPLRKTILEQKTLPACPAASLPRLQSP